MGIIEKLPAAEVGANDAAEQKSVAAAASTSGKGQAEETSVAAAVSTRSKHDAAEEKLQRRRGWE